MQLELKEILMEKDLRAFEKKGILTVEQLIKLYPLRYKDFSRIKSVIDAQEGEDITGIGKVELVSVKSGNLVEIKIREQNGSVFYVPLFGRASIAKHFEKGTFFFFCGTFDIMPLDTKEKNILKNVLLWGKESELSKADLYYPIYSKIGKVQNETLRRYIRKCLEQYQVDEYLSTDEMAQFKLISQEMAYVKIHIPKSEDDIRQAKRRLLFDGLYQFAMDLHQQQVCTSTDVVIRQHSIFDKIISNLPYQLTEGQKAAIKSTYVKLKNGTTINMLIQGDVGAGKSIVTFLIMVLIAENNFQAVLMAPTSVLANQHYNEIKRLTEPYNIQTVLLTGELKAAERKRVLKEIEKGEAKLIIGTQSLISDSVKYHNIGIFINDEEHRFGVAQKDIFRNKDKGIHYIGCTATPIPRSLALTIYGEHTEVIEIKNMPAGRKAIKTQYSSNIGHAYARIISEIEEKHQAYIICPLIEESACDMLKDVCSVEQAYKEASESFPRYKIGYITGNMKQQEINEVLNAFAKHEYDILISTTIVEVGVNVPNATTIIIRNAERFGLAQLHQLRGRVGRGENQSYAFLISDSKNEKLEVMVRTTDGFEIAAEDLKIRGTGELTGLKQSGYSEQLEQALRSPKTFSRIKQLVEIHSSKKSHR